MGDSGNMTAKLHEIEIALKDQGFHVEGRQHIMYMLFFTFADSPTHTPPYTHAYDTPLGDF